MNNWYLIKTKLHQEKIALKNLENQGFIAYCPMVQIKNKITPLFVGYVFVQNIEEQNIHPIKSTKGVLHIVRFGVDFAIVPHKIIDELQQKENKIGDKFIDMKALHQGDKVEILDGVFKGNNAIFTEINADNRAVLLLKLINREHKLIVEQNQITKF